MTRINVERAGGAATETILKVLVLGAGVVGTASAYYLNRAGCEVTVVDRCAQPAAETSFANGGQISVGHAEPWANPHAPAKLLRWLGRKDAPLRFVPRADWRQWLWGLQFLRECTPARTRRNIGQLVRLGLYSRESLAALRRDTGVAYDHRQRGILHFYTDAREFEAALAPARLMRELGCERRVIDAAEAVAIEPALRHLGAALAGATFTADDESGDACLFTRRLADHCAAAGVKFLFGHDVRALRAAGGAIDHVEATDAQGRYVALRADACVLAAGSFSALLAAPLGVRLAVYPAKGYSVTMPVADAAAAWETSLTDDGHKLVFSRLGERLRIAGTAELSGYGRQLDAARCRAIVERVQAVFPGAGDAGRAEFWSGLRPATPSNVPYIGRTRIGGLYLNTGHGTLGWTHACGSGRIVADIVLGRTPEIDVGRGDRPVRRGRAISPAGEPA